MALSGSVNTSSYDGRYYTVSWTAEQSTSNNTSTVNWTLKAVGGNSGWYAERTLKVVLGGTTVYSKTDRVSRYTGTIASGTQTISHDANGDASFTINIQAAVYYSTVNCTGSKTFTLDNIPRKSTLTASNGTLGTQQTLAVTRKSTSFTHTITYKCGTASGTIVTKSTSTSINYTPALSLASQNTTGTSVSITLTITTYNGSDTVGTSSITITCTIPSTVIPSCSISVNDPLGHLTTYGGYIQGHSTLGVAITPTLAYGSEIASYKTTIDGAAYTSNNFTTVPIISSGEVTISATVTDKRGRKGTAETSVNILPYAAPTVTKVTVKRCDEDGTENIRGEYAKVTYSVTATNINNKTTVMGAVAYKKQSDTDYTFGTLFVVDETYSITDATYIFEADSGVSYDIRVIVSDEFDDDVYTTVLSTGNVIMHWREDGRGMGVGKIGEVQDGFDLGYVVVPNEGFANISLEPYVDLNDIKTPNIYVSVNNETETYSNCPLTSGTFTLDVKSGGAEGQVYQTITYTSKEDIKIWVRHYYSSAWGDWLKVYPVDDSGWVNCYPTTYFDKYSSDNTFLQVRKIGSIVHLRGVVTPLQDITPTSDKEWILGQLPGEQYAPAYDERYVCQGSGSHRFVITISASNRYIYVSRYSDTTTANETLKEGDWLNCFATWFVD